jgi:integrase
MGREHVVRLSEGAMAVLEQAKALRLDDNDLVFPSRVGRMLSDNTLSKLMRDDGLDGTPHGFRTSFKVWASENAIRDEVSEAVLAHGDPNKVRAAYRRTTFLEDRRKAMAEWSAFVGVVRVAQTSDDSIVRERLSNLQALRSP